MPAVTVLLCIFFRRQFIMRTWHLAEQRQLLKSPSKTPLHPLSEATFSSSSELAGPGFSNIKISCVWSLAEPVLPQCGHGKPYQSSFEKNVQLAPPPPISPQNITLPDISTSHSETSNSTDRRQSLSSEVPSDDKCLQLLNQSVNPNRVFENYLARAKRKERERSKKSQCKVKKWWVTEKKVAKKKLMCSKCNRGFHKAFGLQVHSRRCQVSSAPQRKFQCKICNAELKMANVKGHMKGKHQLKMKEYGALYQRRLFNCKICDADLSMNKASVIEHLEGLHFLSLNKYCAYYGALYT